jgi:hypothetical protein
MLQVIGAGLGRTGTHSLGFALERLGYGPCYNIQEVSKNPGHAEIWSSAIDGAAVDWDALFAGYASAVEWPTVAFLPEVVGHFPGAKVVLTLRDPESWYASASATIFEALELSAHNPDPVRRANGRMNRRLILERTFGGRYWEKAHALEVYRRHHQTVLEVVPPERLLQYRVEDGWEPLCAFLEEPVAPEPFPRLNDRAAMEASAPDWAKKLRRSRGT